MFHILVYSQIWLYIPNLEFRTTFSTSCSPLKFRQIKHEKNIDTLKQLYFQQIIGNMIIILQTYWEIFQNFHGNLLNIERHIQIKKVAKSHSNLINNL